MSENNHPKRAKPVAEGTPTLEEIKAARQAAGLTQKEAAGLIWYEEITWKQWEGGARRMHPCAWWAFQQRASVLKVAPKRPATWREHGVSPNDLITTPCPLCDADAGHYCDPDKGVTHAGFHDARVDAARMRVPLSKESSQPPRVAQGQ